MTDSKPRTGFGALVDYWGLVGTRGVIVSLWSFLRGDRNQCLHSSTTETTWPTTGESVRRCDSCGRYFPGGER